MKLNTDVGLSVHR